MRPPNACVSDLAFAGQSRAGTGSAHARSAAEHRPFGKGPTCPDRRCKLLGPGCPSGRVERPQSVRRRVHNTAQGS
eukprot:4484473-Alexandrium_andersonii.AAC.1